MALNTIKIVSESKGQRAKARLQVSEFLAVALHEESLKVSVMLNLKKQLITSRLTYPTKAAYWNTPRPLAILASEETARGLPLITKL